MVARRLRVLNGLQFLLSLMQRSTVIEKTVCTVSTRIRVVTTMTMLTVVSGTLVVGALETVTNLLIIVNRTFGSMVISVTSLLTCMPLVTRTF